jgi:hypothetical protein
MKRKILLLSAVCFSVGAAQAQIKAYAITGSQKGSSNWSEVRLVDVSTGDELKTIYKNAQEIEKLNARTGKPIAKKDQTTVNSTVAAPSVTVYRTDGDNKMVIVRKSAPHATHIQSDAPFATSSAALAYDKKHDRLYYTPMGINELRYIDMKSKTTRVYYFEGESFGALKSRGDVPNQITRMVIGSNGKGYALTNNADHLIEFETDKKPEVKDLGPLVDDAANGVNSIHSTGNYGGDIIADAFGGLYLIGANAKVFKIDVKTLTATYKGRIKGLPAGFSTNGAAVEKDGEGSVVVCSSTSTSGYYRFDLQTLQAEKASSGATVFNASDLANGFLAYSKKNKPEEPKEEPKQPIAVVDEPKKENQPNTNNTTGAATPQNTVATAQRGTPQQQQLTEGTISVYPNPVTTGVTRVSFKDYVSGRYQVQVMDISGKLLSTQTVNVNNKLQVEELRLPQYIAKGSYMVKVLNEENKVVGVNPIIVQ